MNLKEDEGGIEEMELEELQGIFKEIIIKTATDLCETKNWKMKSSRWWNQEV